MALPFELQVGLRYVRAGRGGRRNRFISFISGVSMIGIALGVMALIVVLSVMNGFQREVRDRMLNVIAHVELLDYSGQALPDWHATAAKARQNPEVIGAAPFVAAQSLIAHGGDDMRGAIIRGISPSDEAQVTGLGAELKDGVFAKLEPGAWNIVLGAELARQLHVAAGDKVTLAAPGGQVTPAGTVPRLRAFTVVGTFSAGHYEYDSGLALIHLDDAAKFFRTEGPTGVQLKLRDVNEARHVGAELARVMGPDILVRDWTRANATWFDAVQIEKRMMSIVLALIVAVAAFNLVSTLVMTVTDKQADIAILRTLGASPGSIMKIFVIQGALVGLIGTALGVGFGVLVSLNIDVIVPFIEHVLHVQFLPKSIYVISELPSDLIWSDVWTIGGVAVVLAFLATLYPSWAAARVKPAEALRYE